MIENKDWVTINNMILSINSTEDLSVMRKYFLEGLQFLIAFDKATFSLIEDNMDTFELINPIAVGADSDFIENYLSIPEPADYVTPMANLRQSAAYRDSDLLDDKNRTETDFYQNFLLKYGVPYAGGMILAKSGRLLGEVTLFRTEKQGDFMGRDIEILDILRSHLDNRLYRAVKNMSGGISLEQVSVQLMRMGLTKRELESAELAVRGLKNEEIGSALCVSVHTVKKHLNSIYKKLNVTGKMELVRYIRSLE